MVIPDTPTKRREYEQQVVKTFFLSNADLKETIDLLRVVLGARRVAPLPGANALTINDTPDKVAPPSASWTSSTSGGPRSWWRSRSSR